MSTVILDTITGKTTSTNITIGSTPVVSASANSMTIRGEGTAQTSIQQGLVKTWINLNGTGTIDTRDSFNSSGIVDNGTGEYINNLTNAMANTTYAASGESGTLGANNENMFVCTFGRSTGSVRGSNMSDGGAASDRDLYCIMVAGDLA